MSRPTGSIRDRHARLHRSGAPRRPAPVGHRRLLRGEIRSRSRLPSAAGGTIDAAFDDAATHACTSASRASASSSSLTSAVSSGSRSSASYAAQQHDALGHPVERVSVTPIWDRGSTARGRSSPHRRPPEPCQLLFHRSGRQHARTEPQEARRVPVVDWLRLGYHGTHTPAPSPATRSP